MKRMGYPPSKSEEGQGGCPLPLEKKKNSILFLILALGPVPEGDSGSGDEVQECSSPQTNLEKVRSGMDID